MIKNKFFYINLLLFILAFIFISYEIRYACIYGDDIVDFFPYNWYFFHGRIITELVSVFLIKTLPSVLHIHIQNFALFSETVFKALIYCSVVYVISHSYNKFKQANILFSCSMILSFFVICAILVQNDFTAHIVKMNEYYNGYITAALFYLLFWYKMKSFYIEDSFNNKKYNYLILFLLGILNLTSNEELAIAELILAFIVLTEYFYLYKIKRKDILAGDIRKLFYLLAGLTIIKIALWQNPCSINMILNDHNLRINFNIEFSSFINFFKMFYKNAILNNIYFVIILFVNSFVILLHKDTNKKELKFILYSLIGFFIFQLSTILFPANCYCTNEDYRFWFLHGGLISDFSICLYFFTLYTTGYIYNIFKDNIKIKYVYILSFFILGSLYSYPAIHNNSGLCFSTKAERQDMYIVDKLSLFYLKRNETVILPPTKNFALGIIYGQDDTDTMYKGMTVCNQEIRENHYLNYINYAYGDINTSQCISFTVRDDALEKYKENGGKLTKDELEKLDFRNIEKQFD